MAKTRKVLMLVENLSVPADPRVWREAQALRHQGFQVSIICPRGETRDREPYACIDDIHIYRYTLPTTSNYLKEYGIALIKTCALSFKVLFKHGFDVIHSANPPDIFFTLGLFYRLLGKKYIFDQHDLMPEMFRIKFRNRMQALYKLLLFFEWCSYKVAHVVITTNISQQQVAFDRGHCSPDKVFIVRNGPDLSKFTTVPYQAELKQGKRVLLAYIGVMNVQDGVDNVLYALHDLVYKRGHHDVGLVLMGDGEQLAHLRALASELKLDAYVTFTGWVMMKDMLRYLNVADIGLSPDPSNELNDQSTMLKTMEYMAMGKPIVAFDLPETRFSAQDAALYATSNRIEDFADKIEILLKNEALRLKMGARGRKRIEEQLSWNRTSENLALAYKRLFPDLSDGPPGAAHTDASTPTLYTHV